MEGKWIWLNRKDHPELQVAPFTVFSKENKDFKFCVAEFSKSFVLSKRVLFFKVSIAAFSKYFLWVNDDYIGEGSCCPGHENGRDEKATKAYFTEYTLPPKGNHLEFKVLVRNIPVTNTEATCGTGALVLSCEIVYDDGTMDVVSTDDSWDVSIVERFVSKSLVDYSLGESQKEKAEIKNLNVVLTDSQLQCLTEEKVLPNRNDVFVCPPGIEAVFTVEFGRIWSSHVCLNASGDDYELTIGTIESGDELQSEETVLSKGNIKYRSMNLYSAEKVIIKVKNNGEKEVRIFDVQLDFVHYPSTSRAMFATSDDELNKIWSICTHTDSICRQSVLLDSVLKRNAFEKIGEKRVQALNEYYVFGETALAKSDILKTAEIIDYSDGQMTDTVSPLIWAMMLWDYYVYTGDSKLFDETKNAQLKIMSEFQTYLGSNGLFEKCKDYSSVDKVVIDGFDMMYPPKALGQATLMAFYINALNIFAKISAVTEDDKLGIMSRRALSNAISAFNTNFYDSINNLYFAGLGTTTRNSSNTNPENVNRKYYIRHPNILAVLFDICKAENRANIVSNIVKNSDLGPVQPYFMNYLFEMLMKTGDFKYYGIEIIRRWSSLLDSQEKKLSENWGDYLGDFSHASSTCPSHVLVKAFLGFEMIKPGFEEIKLSPSLFGLENASISMPTPYGAIECRMKNGKEPKLSVPGGIRCVVAR